MHQEPLHWLGQMRDEGRRDPMGSWRFVVCNSLLHGVLEVPQGVVEYRLPLVQYNPRGRGPGTVFQGPVSSKSFGIQRLPVRLDLPNDLLGLHEHFL